MSKRQRCFLTVTGALLLSPSPPAGRPVAEIRVGRITATIWQNTPTDEGVFYSVHITRLFRRGSTWDRTPAFGRDDLLTVAKVADLANTRIYELQNAIEFRNPQDDADAAGAA